MQRRTFLGATLASLGAVSVGGCADLFAPSHALPADAAALLARLEHALPTVDRSQLVSAIVAATGRTQPDPRRLAVADRLPSPALTRLAVADVRIRMPGPAPSPQ